MATGYELGQDIDKVEDVLARLRKQGQTLTSAHDRVEDAAQLLTRAWRGPDAQRGIRNARASARAALLAAQAVTAMATALQQQVEEQKTASGVGGAGTPGGPGTVPVGYGPGGGPGGGGSGPGGAPTAPTAPTGPGSGPGEAGGPDFVVGPPTEPHIEWDEGFEYDSRWANPKDYLLREKWQAMLAGASILRPDLDDSLQMYRHYWDNNGEDIEFDYEEAYNEDAGIRSQVDHEIQLAQQGAAELIAAGHTTFSMTGDAHAPGTYYPDTENWQKAIGAHQTWSSADVSVDGDVVTMVVTVHGEDHYNFNPGQADIASGASDDENGRFTEVGWAKPFDSHGEITRTITWNVNDPSDVTVTDSGDGPERNPGREDRTDERDSGDSDRPNVPDNNRDTGRAHG